MILWRTARCVTKDPIFFHASQMFYEIHEIFPNGFPISLYHIRGLGETVCVVISIHFNYLTRETFRHMLLSQHKDAVSAF